MEPGTTVVVAGATSSVAMPVVTALAQHHDVVAVARFGDPAARDRLTEAGVRCVAADLRCDSLAHVPDDAAYVLNFAVVKTGDWNVDLDGNTASIARLMLRCRSARAVLHCSSTAVYQPAPGPLSEDAPLGDHHRVWPSMATYSISKIAAEAMARFCASEHRIPTTIARLNVPYGGWGGWPATHLRAVLSGRPVHVHDSAPNVFNPIHTDDIVAQIPALLAAASVPATVVNWGGSVPVAVEVWAAYLGGLVGAEVDLRRTPLTVHGAEIDTARMHRLLGESTVHWRDGMYRMAEALAPDRLISTTRIDGT